MFTLFGRPTPRRIWEGIHALCYTSTLAEGGGCYSFTRADVLAMTVREFRFFQRRIGEAVGAENEVRRKAAAKTKGGK